MSTLDATGFTRTRLDERLAALQTAAQNIFGVTISLDPDSIDGQTLGIFAEALSNLDQLTEDTYHSFSPQYATGVGLSRLVQLNGIRRSAGAFSLVTIRCGGTQDTIILAGSLVKSTSTNAVFTTLANATILSSGLVDVPARAVVLGVQLAPAGTLTKIDTPTFGWQTATNIVGAVPGKEEETDEALRVRRRASTATPGSATVDAIFGALSNLVGVTQALVKENATNATDGNGLPPHSILSVVQGGVQQTILDTIWLKSAAGVTVHGSISGTVTDTQGHLHAMKFSRPIDVPVYITVNVVMKVGWPSDGVDKIKAALVAWGLTNLLIGGEVIQSRLFEPINSIPGHSITTVFLGLAPSPSSPNNLAIAFDALAAFATARIVVNAT